MKAQTEAAIRNIVGLDPEVKQENIERAIRYLKGESRGGSVDSLFGQFDREDMLRALSKLPPEQRAEALKEMKKRLRRGR